MRAAKVIAHRAGAGRAPENTLEAIEIAHAQGAQWVEMDVSWMGDGTLLVCHDGRVDRCTNGVGSLRELGREEVRSLDAGAWFSPEFAGARLPLLDEVLNRLATHGMGINLEVKIHHDDEPALMVPSLIEALERWGRPESLIVSSFSSELLDVLHRASPTTPKGLLFERLPDDWSTRADALDAVSVHLDHRTITPDQVAAIKRSERDVYLWTVNDPDAVTTLWPAGLDGVITDWPERWDL